MSDNFEEVEVTLPDDVLFKLMMMAHQRDITLNQLCNEILRHELQSDGEDDGDTRI
jgi:hypothetical protein